MTLLYIRKEDLEHVEKFGEGTIFVCRDQPFSDWVPVIEVSLKNTRKLGGFDKMVETLKQAERMNREVLPKFNWSTPFLDANAIQFLNEVTLMVSETLSEVEDL